MYQFHCRMTLLLSFVGGLADCYFWVAMKFWALLSWHPWFLEDEIQDTPGLVNFWKKQPKCVGKEAPGSSGELTVTQWSQNVTRIPHQILSSVRIAAVLCTLHDEIQQCCDPQLQGCHTLLCWTWQGKSQGMQRRLEPHRLLSGYLCLWSERAQWSGIKNTLSFILEQEFVIYLLSLEKANGQYLVGNSSVKLNSCT